MRILPFFWFLLAFVCTSVLTFASIQHTHAPAILQVHVRHNQPGAGLTTFELHFTDPQGLPIDEAEIHSSARMTNMKMFADQPHLYKTGEGQYGVDSSANTISYVERVEEGQVLIMQRNSRFSASWPHLLHLSLFEKVILVNSVMLIIEALTGFWVTSHHLEHVNLKF